MTTRDELMRAVVESPEDDELRLVVADWLEEHGELKRAELIRRQVGGRSDDNLEHEVDQLERGGRPGWVRADYHRGFIDSIRINPKWPFADYLASAEAAALFASHPVSLLHLRARDAEEVTESDARALAANPHLDHLRGLAIEDAIIEVPALAALGTWQGAGLRRLDLDNADLTEEGVGVLVDSPLLRRLPELALGRNRLTPGALRRLVEGLRDSRIEDLGLYGAGVGDDGARLIASARWPSSLCRLDLAANYLTDVGARAILDSPNLRALADLRLVENSSIEAERTPLVARFGPRVLSYD